MVCGHLDTNVGGIADELIKTPKAPVQPEPAEPPEPQFVVSRGDATEQDTEETVAVGVCEVSGDEPDADWGLDDDAADYSAAV